MATPSSSHLPSRTLANIGCVEDDGFPEGFCVSEELMAYVQLAQACTRSYADNINMSKILVDAWTRFNTRSIGQLSLGVALGIPEDMIEWGMRFCTGAGGADKDIEKALALWTHVTDPKADPLYPPLSRKPSRRTIATAHCLRASVYRERALAKAESLQIDDLLRAARAANASAALGFITPVVLVLAKFINGPIGLHGDMVLRELPQFAGLEEMWAAWAMREEEVERGRMARDKKVARAPNTYVCAAEGCGIRGLQRSALLSCGGKCEGVHKAHYCSKECQKKDWKRHKPFCKPGCPNADEMLEPRSNVDDLSSTMTDGQRSTSAKSPWDEELLPQDPKKQRVITVPAPGRPGEYVEIASSTMTPAMLRDMKAKLEEEYGNGTTFL